MGVTDGYFQQAMFQYPYGITLDQGRGFLYVCCNHSAQQFQLRRLDLHGRTVQTLVTNRCCTDVMGLTMDLEKNHLYLIDDNTVKRIRLPNFESEPERTEINLEWVCGTELVGHSDGSFETAKFFKPFDLIFHPGNRNIYVSDTWNQTIRVVSLLERKVSTLCGKCDQSGYANGDFINCRYSIPAD